MLIISIVIFAAFIASIAFIAYCIFTPYRDVVKREPIEKKRFQLTDLLSFFFTFQLGFGAIGLIFPDIDWTPEIAIVVTIIVLSISGIAWFYGIRILWRTDTTDATKRITLLGVIMPFGFVVPVVFVPLLITIQTPIQFFVRLASLVLFILLLRYLSFWILSDETKHQTRDSKNAE